MAMLNMIVVPTEIHPVASKERWQYMIFPLSSVAHQPNFQKRVQPNGVR
jgi:hypothetical protein